MTELNEEILAQRIAELRARETVNQTPLPIQSPTAARPQVPMAVWIGGGFVGLIVLAGLIGAIAAFSQQPKAKVEPAAPVVVPFPVPSPSVTPQVEPQVTATPTAIAHPHFVNVANDECLNVRYSPEGQESGLCLMPGSIVNVVQVVNGWAEINHELLPQGKQGWASKKFLTAIGQDKK